jgi:hypothetical protein
LSAQHSTKLNKIIANSSPSFCVVKFIQTLKRIFKLYQKPLMILLNPVFYALIQFKHARPQIENNAFLTKNGFNRSFIGAKINYLSDLVQL